MFLLPAIGAWISDGLILYIHFTKGSSGTSGDHPVAVNLTSQFWDCTGFTAADCLRRRAQDVSTFANVVDTREDSFSNAVLNETLDDSINLDEDATLYGISFDAITLSSDADAPEEESDDTEQVGISAERIESSTGYLVILAIIRLTLLSLPLSYAAFYGTRVICVICHYIFEGASAMVVVSHMMAVLILNPSSFSAKGDTANPIGDSVIDGLDGVVEGNDTLFENAWALLTLSLVSILLHFLIVLHVRSTGPATQDWLYEERIRKRKRMAYAMAARSNSIRGKGLGSTDAIISIDNGEDDEEEGADGTPLLLPGGNGLSMDKNLSNNSRRSFSSEQWRERLRCLPEQYEAFMGEAQVRLDAARRMWTSRLEAVSHGQDNVREGADIENGDAVVTSQSNQTNLLTQATSQLQKLSRPDPFRVLLQLFAYEDVWTNHRLDLAFSCEPNSSGIVDAVSNERRAALSFYAPQLLSFLLHGAYLDVSHRLEEWILKRCEEDLHFAHRCFWFLRAWCLGSQKAIHNRTRSGGSLNELNGHSITLNPSNQLSANELAFQLRGSETNLYLSCYQNCNSKSASSMIDVENSYLRMNSGERESSPSKYSLDERVLIEELLRRVIRRGSLPANKAQYGSINEEIRIDLEPGDNFSSSPSALATAVEKGLVPIDPGTGFHSTRHLDCITSPQKFGFLPLNKSGDPYQETSGSLRHDAVSLFLSAPIFMDALLSIADDLMDTPKANRTAVLRQRLRSLEVELLPSNVIYLPIGLGNMQHRVWRIVSEESLALSTNERVPCIATLEVIDYAHTNHVSISSGESVTLANWVNNPRPPKRHITLIDKVATYTQEGLKRLDDHFSQHGDGKAGALDRRLADFLQLSNSDAWKKYSPVQMVESDDDESSGSKNNDELHSKDKDGLCFELGPPPLLPAPPLGSPTPSMQVNEQSIPSLIPTDTNEHVQLAVPASPLDAPCTPTKAETPDSPMGQWSTPTSARKPSVKLRKRMNFIDEIAEEGSLDSSSPQAKQRQRKQVTFPSSSNNTQQRDSIPTEEVSQASSTGPSPAPAVVFKEDWKSKTERLRKSSVYGSHDGWRLLPILIKSNDDLRQEQLASQLIQRMALILAKANIPVWLKPYEIIALTGRGGGEYISLLYSILDSLCTHRCFLFQ
jgi:hypothetical protein